MVSKSCEIADEHKQCKIEKPRARLYVYVFCASGRCITFEQSYPQATA